MIGYSVVIPFRDVLGTVFGAVARHGESDRRALFPDPFYSGKKKGVWDGPFLKEGG